MAFVLLLGVLAVVFWNWILAFAALVLVVWVTTGIYHAVSAVPVWDWGLIALTAATIVGIGFWRQMPGHAATMKYWRVGKWVVVLKV